MIWDLVRDARTYVAFLIMHPKDRNMIVRAMKGLSQ